MFFTLHTCTAKKKKFRFQSLPETQNLLITVMEIEAKQYARIEIDGLFVIEVGTARAPEDFARAGDERPLPAGMLMA